MTLCLRWNLTSRSAVNHLNDVEPHTIVPELTVCTVGHSNCEVYDDCLASAHRMLVVSALRFSQWVVSPQPHSATTILRAFPSSVTPNYFRSKTLEGGLQTSVLLHFGRDIRPGWCSQSFFNTRPTTEERSKTVLAAWRGHSAPCLTTNRNKHPTIAIITPPPSLRPQPTVCVTLYTSLDCTIPGVSTRHK